MSYFVRLMNRYARPMNRQAERKGHFPAKAGPLSEIPDIQCYGSLTLFVLLS